MLGDIHCQDVRWTPAVQDRDQWWTVVNTLINIQVPYTSEKRIFRLVMVFNQ
jgi:hypothetical protein